MHFEHFLPINNYVSLCLGWLRDKEMVFIEVPGSNLTQVLGPLFVFFPILSFSDAQILAFDIQLEFFH